MNTETTQTATETALEAAKEVEIRDQHGEMLQHDEPIEAPQEPIKETGVEAQDQAPEQESAEDDEAESDRASELEERLAALEAEKIMSIAGGDEAYRELTTWAADNIPEVGIEMFNRAIEHGTTDEATYAVQVLMQLRQQEHGFEGVQFNDTNNANNTPQGYSGEDQLYADLANPLYTESSPAGEAFRNRVLQKMQSLPIQTDHNGWTSA